MRHAKPVRLKTAPTGEQRDLSGRDDMSYGSESQIALPHEAIYAHPSLFLEFTIVIKITYGGVDVCSFQSKQKQNLISHHGN